MSTDAIRPISYKQLIRDHGQIRIPRLQRDYAQGRTSQTEVRENFLKVLQEHLELPPDDSKLPLNLDFIYGSRAEGAFLPLDGQQRLTTLFLLHWYLAWKDGCWSEFEELFCGTEHARFSYSVRTTSTEFFDKLVAHPPQCRPEDLEVISAWLEDQPWYFRYWRLDPTIQAVLNMLDAMHRRFSRSSGLYARLTDDKRPAITFQLLDLERFKLTDDLYIKMNARGKPLTAFETFKAGYEEKLKELFPGETRNIGEESLPIAEFVARKMDTSWADFFWTHRQEDSAIYDEAVMNLFRVVALVSRDPGDSRYFKHASLLRDESNLPSYSTFAAQGWLDESFTRMLISLLEAWCNAEDLSQPLLDSPYFDEKKVFQKLIEAPTKLTAPEVVLFTGYALFIQAHEGKIDAGPFREWMRVVHNLAVNSDIDRTDRLQSPAKGLRDLLPHSTKILEHLCTLGAKDKVAGFTEQQLREERMKAGLILRHEGWRTLVERAECHGYFRGQIDFLCEFSGAVEQWQSSGSFDWSAETHRHLQERFQDYLAKAEAMFTGHGVMNLGDCRWQRALLSVGDYTLPTGRNWSFLADAQTDVASWKRLLRGSTQDDPGKRPLLKQLWDRLKADRPLSQQLDELVAAATGLRPWIEAFVRTPHAIEYCGQKLMRWESENEIYLLSKSRMKGMYAELFSYTLHHTVLQKLQKNGSLKPLEPFGYLSVSGRDHQPSIPLKFIYGGEELWFWIGFQGGRYYLSTGRGKLNEFPELHTLLCSAGGFTDGEKSLSKHMFPDAIEPAVSELAQLLATLPAKT
ncbi:uncharacterized protein DUF262 [Roseimicrobium gellanilyticum]|uniref:Uncharacterized protein DUF262 n=1 Tax=Roseimicrobium gellanilyticum TaxID=748857 RepID=A0A366HMC8_9BACT|nr:DUF262 domain-containing protein [Roseimicrobium gellanilyticum]RBP43606.1 uncharacterized protein DUF262 [Roseimicrobium gellanilyticum]